jgi:hypothetical protein
VLTFNSGTNDVVASSNPAVVSAVTAYAIGLTFWPACGNIITGGMTINVDSVDLEDIS